MTVSRTWFQSFTQTKSSNDSCNEPTLPAVGRAAMSDRRTLVFRLICVCIFLCLRNFGFWPFRIEWLRRGSAPPAMFRVHLWQAGLIAAEDASFLYHLGWGAPTVGCSIFSGLCSMCVCVCTKMMFDLFHATYFLFFVFWSEHVCLFLNRTSFLFWSEHAFFVPGVSMFLFWSGHDLFHSCLIIFAFVLAALSASQKSFPRCNLS